MFVDCQRFLVRSWEKGGVICIHMGRGGEERTGEGGRKWGKSPEERREVEKVQVLISIKTVGQDKLAGSGLIRNDREEIVTKNHVGTCDNNFGTRSRDSKTGINLSCVCKKEG